MVSMRSLMLVLLGLAVAPGFGNPVQAQPAGPRGERIGAPRAGLNPGGLPQLRGVLKEVNPQRGTLTVTILEERRMADHTFTLGREAEVIVDDGRGRRFSLREGHLTDLVPGDWITLTLSPDPKVVEAVLAEGPTVQGMVGKVEASKSTFSLVTTGMPGQAAKEKTYRLAPGAEVAVDDGRGRRFSLREGKLADVRTGDLASLKLSPDLKEVRSLLVEGPFIHGTVQEIDAKQHAVTLSVPNSRGETENKTFRVASDADVMLDTGRGSAFSYREGKLAAVPVGAQVTLKMTLDQKQAVAVRAEGPIVHALLRGVHTADGTIVVSVRPSPGAAAQEKTMRVTPTTRVHVNGIRKTIDDLKAHENEPVTLKLSLDQKSVQAVKAGREE